MILAGREQIAADLRSYGEAELAERVASRDAVSGSEIATICALAGTKLMDDEYATPSGSSMMIAKALALAAVEILEGPRPLRRTRRRPSRD